MLTRPCFLLNLNLEPNSKYLNHISLEGIIGPESYNIFFFVLVASYFILMRKCLYNVIIYVSKTVMMLKEGMPPDSPRKYTA